jgi:AmmeMemoRadiSam system protein A
MGWHTRWTTGNRHGGNRDAVDPRGPLLLGIARSTLEERLLGSLDPDAAFGGALPHWLLDPAATFVSLHQDTRLRGCVGSLEPLRTLYEDVRRNAIAAALEDSRFPPVEPGELAELTIEVTLLSAREPLHHRSERDALDQLRPHVDGLVLTYGSRRATFLPQVWESIPEATSFLETLKEKAGLERDFWHRSILLERYTATRWCEAVGV